MDKLASDAAPLSSQRCDELETLLNRHSAVQEAVVIERPDEHGKRLTVAYVVPTDVRSLDTLFESLQGDIPQLLKVDNHVLISSLPITDDGGADLERLTQYEVIDEELVGRWTRALNGVDDLRPVTVLPLEQTPEVGEVHRSDLLPPQPTAVNEAGGTYQRTAQTDNGAAATRPNNPAIVHGAELIFPDDHPQTLGLALRRAAEEFPARGIHYVAANGTRSFQSYPELLADAQRVLSGLQRLGRKPGDKVIFQLEENREFVVSFWACILGGMVPVPVTIALDYTLSNPAVQKLVNAWRMLDMPLILSSKGLAGKVEQVFAQNDADTTACIVSFNALPAGQAIDPSHEIKPEDLALLLLTSGSTGLPKAVMHSHKTLLSRSASTSRFNHFNGNDISLNWMPLDHVGGIVMFHLRDVYNGCTQLQVATDWILEQPLRWLDLIDEYQVTVTWAPNFAYGLIADKTEEIARRQWDLSSMRFILNGGEAVVAKTSLRFLRMLAPHGLAPDCMFPAWGMSETASGIAYSHRFSPANINEDDEAVEVGRPIPGTSFRIVDEQDRVIREGEKGRLQVKGPSIMLGYYQNSEMNNIVFSHDGWLDTGDVGILNNGRLTVTARIKDEIIINGINYPAAEIEAVTDTVEGVEVSFSAACAVRRPKTDTDELAIFFCSLDPAEERLTEILMGIRAHVTAKMGIQPHVLVPVTKDQIPKTAIGKIQRSQLKQRLEKGEFADEIRLAERLSRTNLIPNWFYRKDWHRKDLRIKRLVSDLGPSLVFVDRHGLGNALCEQLKNAQLPCVKVEMGTEFQRIAGDHFRIDPANREHYRQLVQEVHGSGLDIQQVVHLWTYDDNEQAVDSLQELVDAQYVGVYSLLFMVQALASMEGDVRDLRLLTVSSGAQVTGAEDKSSCKHATLMGLLKTIPLELPGIDCRHVDVPFACEANLTHVTDELLALTKDDEVAYRHGRRFTWELSAVNLAEKDACQMPVRPGGIYLVTGGLGGIGVYISKALMRDHGAKLIIVGTTPLPDRSQWPHYLDRGGKVADRIRQYLDLESAGTEFVYECADVMDGARLSNAVASAESRWGATLAGIFHLAVGGDIGSYWRELDTHYLRTETPESFDDMFRTKVYGTWVLYQLLRERPEAIMVTFGSVLGVFGAARFGSYSAAHTFLNSFSARQRAGKFSRIYNFSWAVWEGVGLSKSDPAFAKDFYRSSGFCLISKENGLDCLMGALSRDQGGLIVGLDPRAWNVRQHITSPSQGLQGLLAFYEKPPVHDSIKVAIETLDIKDCFGNATCCAPYPLVEMPLAMDGRTDTVALAAIYNGQKQGTKNVSPRTDVEERIAEIWRDVLGVSVVNIDDSFFLIGGNSLSATQVNSRLRQAFNIKIDLKDLFEHATVSALARCIEERCEHRQTYHLDEEDEPNDYEDLLENLDDLSDDEVERLLNELQAHE